MLLEQLKQINKSNKIKQFLSEKEMLDISIQNVDKVVTNDTKIKTFLADEYKVEEKFDGCLDYNTPIETLEFGILPIGKIVEEKIECKVKSFDIENNEVLYESILGFSVEDNKDNWFEIILENGKKIIVTENHYIWLPDLKCWRQVKDLKENDNLLLDC